MLSQHLCASVHVHTHANGVVEEHRLTQVCETKVKDR